MMLEVRDRLNFDRGEKLGRELGLAQGHALGLAEGLEQGHEVGLAEGIEQGREAGLAEGIEQGREAGLAEGQKCGEERLAKLLSTLIGDGRESEIASVLCDAVARESLYRHYDIE